jgi:flagellar assembly protein FliH
LQQAGKEYKEKLAQLGDMFQAAILELEAIKERLRLDAMKDVLDFSISAASKLTFAIGELHQEAAMENLRRCLALVADKTSVSVRCHPRDVETLRTFSKSIVEQADLAAHVRLIEDESISPGGCIVESGGAEVDASLETQIAELAVALTGTSNHG